MSRWVLMYVPVQVPFLLNSAFRENLEYRESSALELGGFGICLWEMRSRHDVRSTVRNVIVADGCIDIVVAFDEKQIGFSGMSRTDFEYEIECPARYFGVRLMPGAFHQLTGLPASVAMDQFLPFEEVFMDFSEEEFFSLSFDEAKEYLKAYLVGKINDQLPNEFTELFHGLAENLPASTKELWEGLYVSSRQCQRLFLKYYGLSPKMVLSIVRFQSCLQLLTVSKANSVEVASLLGYYDQPHFIRDFKRNMGITPRELVRLYES
jgi:AraC-type DNA-binding domain-containing proteins